MTIEEMKARKIELGFTNETLAEASGVPLGTIQKIFAGVTKAPRRETISMLTRALGVKETGSGGRAGAGGPQDGTGREGSFMKKEFNGIRIPDFDIAGKVAVVTGGTKGLGLATVTTLAFYGAKVVVASRTAADCERVTKELNDAGCDTYPFPTDVTDTEQTERLVKAAVERYGRLDIMINNAGSALTHWALEMTEEDWDSIITLDLRSSVFAARAAARQMVEQGGGGRIINIASMFGVVGAKAISSYCAAKGGLINATRALALEWGRYNITVNCVSPGYIKTEINAYMFEDEEWVKGIMKKTAIQSPCGLNEIAAAIVYLCSDFSGHVTGTNIVIDGGTTAQ